MTDTVDTSKEAVRYIGAETLVPDDEPRQIVCTGEAGGDVWNPAFGEWECDEFGMDSDEPIGKSERLFVNRRLYDALLAERDQLRREVKEARSVRGAAQVLMAACPNPVFDDLKPVLMGEFSQRYPFVDENAYEVSARVNISWTTTKEIIKAALTQLATGSRP